MKRFSSFPSIATGLNPNRRTLLRGLGALGGLLPFHLREKQAQAQGIPTRFVVYYTYHGTQPRSWFPRNAAGGIGTENDFELASIMQPFAQWKNDLLILDNLNMLSTVDDPTPPANSHYAGQTHSLAPVNRASGAKPGGISIDQFIAQELNKNGPVTKYKSLDFFGGSCETKYHDINSVGPGQTYTGECQAKTAYTRLFGSAPSASGDGPEQTALKFRRSVLAGLPDEFNAIKSSLSAADKTKLDAHAQALRDLEKSLLLPATGAACARPGSEILTAAGDKTEANFEVWARLTAAALACDLTRVATLNFDELPESVLSGVGWTPGKFGAPDLHELAHGTDERSGGLFLNPEAMEMNRQYHLVYARAFAKLLKALDEIPEADGKSVLDHTVVLWAGEIATGNHGLDRLPWLLAGSAGGYFKTGRYIRPGKTIAHNDLFVSIANAMGIPITTFGKASVCKGPMPGLKA
ncbi:MAG: DUF1552 domain-containing protein [Deltaproteobacteria bacterium]|nr:DUF1552 domain-containing protein [Deltaproteobacteria bacterium]